MAERNRRRRTRVRLLFALKLLITAALCAFIVWKADWREVGSVFVQADPILLAIVFASMLLCVTISAYKWGLLLDVHGASLSFSRLHRYYLVAVFLNNFLPTSIGGDGYRIYKTLDNRRSKTSAFVAVFMERLTGLAALLCLGFLGGAVGFMLHRHEFSGLVAAAGAVVSALALPFVYLALNRRFTRWIAEHRRTPGVIKNVLQHMKDYRRRRAQSLQVIAVSFGFQAFSLLWLMLLIRALGESIPIYDLAVVSALVALVALVPLAINGIGLVDGSFIYLASQFGVHYEAGLLVMLMQRLLVIPISLIGAVLYLTDRDRAAVRARAARHEADAGCAE